MVCQNCGFPKPPFADFCAKCGSAFIGDENHSIASMQYFGVSPVTPTRRFWSLMLEFALFWLTLGVGWFVWSLILLNKAQSPAKQILDYFVVDARSGKRVQWWRMALRTYLPVALTIFTFFGPLYYIYYTHEAAKELMIPVGGTAVTALLLIADALFVFLPKRKRLIDFIFSTSVTKGHDGTI